MAILPLEVSRIQYFAFLYIEFLVFSVLPTVFLCYLCGQYENVEQAVATRRALHGKRWPASNPKLLGVDFRTMEEVIKSSLLLAIGKYIDIKFIGLSAL